MLWFHLKDGSDLEVKMKGQIQHFKKARRKREYAARRGNRKREMEGAWLGE